MNLKNITNNLQKLMMGAGLVLAAMFASCSDDKENVDNNVAFDPAKPVQVTDFTPKSGGYQEQMLVYGSNFGNDKSRVKLLVGGKEAVIVTLNNTTIYAYIPKGADGSSVEVVLLDENGEEIQRGVSPAGMDFAYTRKRVVGTLVGYRNEDDTQGERFGPFHDPSGNQELAACGFRSAGCMTFDPLYPNRLYIVYDGMNKIVELDLEAKMHNLLMSSSKFGGRRLRNCAFTLDGQYMLVSTDRDDNGTHSTSVWIVRRNSDGTFSDRSSTTVLAAYKQCNGVAVHPVNGEVYFNSYEKGQFFRLDINKYFETINNTEGTSEPWSGYFDEGCFDELFQIYENQWEFNITIHPTGNYAYIDVINRHYILRADYDWKAKKFTQPYLIAGRSGNAGYSDAVGGDSRLSTPYQGIFVKNPAYAGRADEYDYYVCDRGNFCVRSITPDGIVRTYAGHSHNTDNNWWGIEEGDLRTQARFRDVSGIAYDESKDEFYVLDDVNRRIRTIGLESDDDEPTPDEPDQPEQGGEGDVTEE